jgi:hypothetical protein
MVMSDQQQAYADLLKSDEELRSVLVEVEKKLFPIAPVATTRIEHCRFVLKWGPIHGFRVNGRHLKDMPRAHLITLTGLLPSFLGDIAHATERELVRTQEAVKQCRSFLEVINQV